MVHWQTRLSLRSASAHPVMSYSSYSGMAARAFKSLAHEERTAYLGANVAPSGAPSWFCLLCLLRPQDAPANSRCIMIYTYGGFLKWGYPKMDGFKGQSH